MIEPVQRFLENREGQVLSGGIMARFGALARTLRGRGRDTAAGLGDRLLSRAGGEGSLARVPIQIAIF